MVPTRRRFRHSEVSGYTMVEAIIVIAIIGLLLAISIPNLPRWLDKWRIDGAARQAALHISLAKLKAVSHRYPYTVTYVPEGGTYSGVSLSRYATLVISGTEGAGDANGNGTAGESENPLVDKRLVLIFPSKVTVGGTPPVALSGSPTAVPLKFETNGLAKMSASSTGAPLFGLYFTNSNSDWKAVTAHHSGRIKVHSFNSANNTWIED